jgi:hypothetical protein
VIGGFRGELGRRLAMGGAVFTLLTAAVVWSPMLSPASAAEANACGNHSETACDSKAARAEDAAEAKNEKQCRLEHSEASCRNRARAEDEQEKATECDEGDNRKNGDCEPYGAYGEPGDNNLHIAELDAATRSLASAGIDPSVAATTTSIFLVIGTLLFVAFGRRRLEAPMRKPR